MGLLGSGKSYCQTCGMEVDPANECHTEIGGRVYYFCRAGCKASFKKAYFKRTNVPHTDGNKPSKKGGGSCH